jgi:hypothetical protein
MPSVTGRKRRPFNVRWCEPLDLFLDYITKAQNEYVAAVAQSAASGSPTPDSGVPAAMAAVAFQQDRVSTFRQARNKIESELPEWQAEAVAADVEVERLISVIIGDHIQVLVVEASELARRLAPYRSAPSVWPAPRAFTDGIEAGRIEAELNSNLISRSMFGLVAAISAICPRSLINSERALRLRRPSTKLACFALTSGSICAGRAPMESPRMGGLGCNALRICSADTLPSPASAKVAVIDSPAQIVIILSPEKLKRVIVIVLVVIPEGRPAQRFDAWTTGRVLAKAGSAAALAACEAPNKCRSGAASPRCGRRTSPGGATA